MAGKSSKAATPVKPDKTADKKLLRECKQTAITILKNIGIEDSFRIFLRNSPILTKTGWTKNWLGKYSTGSQFTSGMPNISINLRNIEAVTAQINKGWEGTGTTPATVYEGIVDTILHEYGHAVLEWLQHMDQKLYEEALAEFSGCDDPCEDFSEEFMKFCHNDGNHDGYFTGLCAEYNLQVQKASALPPLTFIKEPAGDDDEDAPTCGR
jgi:hypothetical protein